METITNSEELRRALGSRDRSGIGFVPTMGALHAGHRSLVERARRECATVVVSVFVNPTQFNDKTDLKNYPRTPEADLRLLEEVGADYVFMPSVEEVYPEPDTRTFDFGMIDKVMEGATRPGHFNGVAQGAQPLVSRCYGQNDHAGARKLLLLGSGTVLVLAAVLYAAVFGLTDTLVSWFNSENSVQMAQYAHTGMRMYFVGYFFAGFNIMAAGYLSAVNRPVEASITSICRGMVAIVACSLVLSAVFGMPGVWAAFPASELLTALLTLFLLRRKESGKA